MGYQIFVPFKVENESRVLLISPCLLAEWQNIKLLFSVEMNGLSRRIKHCHLHVGKKIFLHV